MKKLLSILFLAVALIFVTGVSCEEEKPLCEQNNFGHVKVINSTSIYIWVDVTEDGDYYNKEVRLAPGTSTTYTMIPGPLTVWAASDANRQLDRWDYDEIWLDQCEEYSFTWRSGKGATTDGDGTYYIDDESSGSPKSYK
jgi:hypothetical protein